MRVDLSAREGHFLEHLAPVWRELPADRRGTIYVATDELEARARELELEEPIVVGWPERGRKLGPIIVASWSDLRVVARTGRKIALFEHGAGQSYGNRHPSYIGGTGREKVSVFIVPSEQAAARTRRYYPTRRVVVAGCPKLDELLELEPPSGPTTVAISFHWRCEVLPETGSAIDAFALELEPTRRRLEAEGIRLLGHAHPRIYDEARAVFRAAGIETVKTFAEVVARAHVYAVDNSSTLFEFAALDRPVVVLNAPEYRRGVEHGLRFWTEADVGLQVDDPAELAPTILEAIADPDPVARSRRAAVGRAYSVRDGSSARIAAEAILSLIRGKCPLCGVPACACGPKTTIVAVDQRVRSREPMAGPLKRYPNPTRPGSFLKLSDADAKRLGLTGGSAAPPVAPPVRLDDVVNELGSSASEPATGPESSPAVDVGAAAPSASTSSEGPPPGALAPGGPTRRARASSSSKSKAPDAPAEGEPKDKARPAPGRRRRRIAEDG